MQREVIDGANTQDADAWQALTDAIHESSTVTAEVVGHLLARGYRLILAICFEQLLSTQVLEVRIFNGEVAGEHGSRDLATVGTITHECLDKALVSINRLLLRQLNPSVSRLN